MKIEKTLRSILKSAEDIPIFDVLIKTIDHEAEKLKYEIIDIVKEFNSIPFSSMPRAKIDTARRINYYLESYRKLTDNNIYFLSDEDNLVVERFAAMAKLSEYSKRQETEEKLHIPCPPTILNYTKYLIVEPARL